MAKKKVPDTSSIVEPTAAPPVRRRTAPKAASKSAAKPASKTPSAGSAAAAAARAETADDTGRTPLSSGNGSAISLTSASSHSTGNGNGSAGATTPSYEQIAEKAYQRYLSRGGNHGDDFQDWIEAERELRTNS